MKSVMNVNVLSVTLILLFSLLYLGGCVSAKQKMLDEGIKPLTTQELQSLFAEKRIAKFNNTQKQRWATVTYLPDRSVSAVSKGKTYTGTYSLENDQFCSKMSHRNGKIKCTTWFDVGDKTYQLYDTGGSMAGKTYFQ